MQLENTSHDSPSNCYPPCSTMITQPVITCSKLTTETQKQGAKYAQS